MYENECDDMSFEVSNVLFDEDIDMNQPTLCLNVYEKQFHVVSNPLFEECAQESEFADGNSFSDCDINGMADFELAALMKSVGGKVVQGECFSFDENALNLMTIWFFYHRALNAMKVI